MFLNNLIFSLNATIPIFLMMALGWILKKTHWLNDNATSILNKLVFRIFLPALLFIDLYKQNFKEIWDNSFVLFCFLATIISIVLAFFIAKTFRISSEDIGEYIQASYRSAAATLGIAFMTNIYDNVAMVALMIIGSVPLYNTVAVVVLSLTSPENDISQSKFLLIRKTLYNVITNPIIDGIILGLLWSIFNIPLPTILNKSITYLANVASPLALIALGASFEIKELSQKLFPVISACFNKLFLFCIIFLPLAIKLGFRDERLVSALIMLGSATTSSSFIMSKNMGHKGIISSSSVMLTTFLSSFTMALWLFILRTLRYI